MDDCGCRMGDYCPFCNPSDWYELSINWKKQLDIKNVQIARLKLETEMETISNTKTIYNGTWAIGRITKLETALRELRDWASRELHDDIEFGAVLHIIDKALAVDAQAALGTSDE